MCKIVIADDEYLEREVVKKIVSGLDGAMIVGECNSGRKAVELCSALRPDIVFLNVRMGGVNGIDAARQIRHENRSVVIFLTTGHDETHYKHYIHDLGIDEYLLKPIKPSKIEEIVKKYSPYRGKPVSTEIPRASKKQIQFYPRHLISNEILKALGYIDENFRDDLSLDRAAQEVYLSSYYFSRLFKREVGVTFSSYITYKKLDEAKTLLETTSKSILEISLYLSFKEQSYFCRVFKKYVGCTPKEYRLLAQERMNERAMLVNHYKEINMPHGHARDISS